MLWTHRVGRYGSIILSEVDFVGRIMEFNYYGAGDKWPHRADSLSVR